MLFGCQFKDPAGVSFGRHRFVMFATESAAAGDVLRSVGDFKMNTMGTAVSASIKFALTRILAPVKARKSSFLKRSYRGRGFLLR